MSPILLELPSKVLALLAVILAGASFVRAWAARGRPGAKASSTPWLLLAGAWALMGLRGGAFVPRVATFREPWVALPIYAYGTMLGTSLVLGWFVALRFAKADGVPQEQAGAIYMWTAVWALVGARLLYVLTNLSAFNRPGDLMATLMVQKGGMVAYGGMIGGFLASWWCCVRRKLPLLQWADVAAPSVALGTGITRIGCLLYGCDYGRPTDRPWALVFPNGSPAWDAHIRRGFIEPHAAGSLPVHPTQVYESLLGFALFALLLGVRRRRRFSGQVFLAWVIGYGIGRPLIEILRDDDQRGQVGPFSTSQAIGMAAVLLALGLSRVLVRKHRRDPSSSRLWDKGGVRSGST